MDNFWNVFCYNTCKWLRLKDYLIANILVIETKMLLQITWYYKDTFLTMLPGDIFKCLWKFSFSQIEPI